MGNSEREISDHVVRLFEAAIARRTKSEMDGYGEGTKIHRLGLAMGLVALYEAKDLGKFHDQTLAQADEDAFNVIGLRKAALDELLLGLAQDGDVKQFFARVRDHAILEVLGRGGRTEIRKYANYLRGQNFWNKLKGLDPAQRNRTAKNEMRKLVALDPALGQEVATVLLARQVQEDPLPVLQEQSADERTRAWSKLLLFLTAIAEREGASQDGAATGIANAKKGAKFVGVAKKATAVLRDAGRRTRIAAVLGRRVPHRAFYSALAADDVAPLMAGMELGTEEKEALGAALSWAKRYGWVGSTVTTLTSLLAVAGMVANWPPTDGNGNIVWSELATLTASGLSTVGSLPTIVTFIKTDLAEFAAKAFGKELAKPAATAATAASEAAKKVGWATRFCKVAGPVGDAIFIGINFHAMLEERKNGDTVGEAARLGQVIGGGIGLIGGLMVLSGSAAATGVGIPLALIGAAVSLVAAVIDWGWGQSDLADAAYRNLSALGLIGAEESAFRRLATDTRTVWRGNRGGVYQATETYRVKHGEVKKRFAAASLNDRVGMINQFLDESTSGSEESLVHACLKQTPYDNGEFLALVEALDGRRLVDELETDWQAGDVLLWTARAYHLAGRTETPELWLQLTELCRQHRPGAVLHFLQKIEKPTYQKLDAEKLRDATLGLTAPPIRDDDKEALLRTLDKMSWAQFDTAMMTGGLPYVHRVRFCLLLGGPAVAEGAGVDARRSGQRRARAVGQLPRDRDLPVQRGLEDDGGHRHRLHDHHHAPDAPLTVRDLRESAQPLREARRRFRRGPTPPRQQPDDAQPGATKLEWRGPALPARAGGPVEGGAGPLGGGRGSDPTQDAARVPRPGRARGAVVLRATRRALPVSEGDRGQHVRRDG